MPKPIYSIPVIGPSTLPPYPDEPFSADSLILFLQGKMQEKAVYYPSDSAFFQALKDAGRRSVPQRLVSTATLRKLLYWDENQGHSFSVHTLEAIWKALEEARASDLGP